MTVQYRLLSVQPRNSNRIKRINNLEFGVHKLGKGKTTIDTAHEFAIFRNNKHNKFKESFQDTEIVFIIDKMIDFQKYILPCTKLSKTAMPKTQRTNKVFMIDCFHNNPKMACGLRTSSVFFIFDFILCRTWPEQAHRLESEKMYLSSFEIHLKDKFREDTQLILLFFGEKVKELIGDLSKQIIFQRQNCFLSEFELSKMVRVTESSSFVTTHRLIVRFYVAL